MNCPCEFLLVKTGYRQNERTNNFNKDHIFQATRQLDVISFFTFPKHWVLRSIIQVLRQWSLHDFLDWREESQWTGTEETREGWWSRATTFRCSGSAILMSLWKKWRLDGCVGAGRRRSVEWRRLREERYIAVDNGSWPSSRREWELYIIGQYLIFLIA